MLTDQAFAPALFLLQDTPGISPIILGIIAILLVALFIWLLLREPKASEVAVEKTADKSAEQVKPIETVSSEAAGAPAPKDETAAEETNKVDLPIVDSAESTPVPAVEPVIEAAAPSVVMAPAAVEPSGTAVVEAVAPAPDDLEIIEGIGPKIAGVLKQAGVITFAQLAAMEPVRITEILHAANMRLADPKTWPEQARLAATGDQAGLQALQSRLKGGREV